MTRADRTKRKRKIKFLQRTLKNDNTQARAKQVARATHKSKLALHLLFATHKDKKIKKCRE